MKKFSGRRLAVLASFVFAAAFSLGTSALAYPGSYQPFPIPDNPPGFPNPPGTVENGPCVGCHEACETALQTCASGGGSGCFLTFQTCRQNCSISIPGCQIP